MRLEPAGGVKDDIMRIRSVRLKNYKRFTDFSITNLPATARLVVLVGPNGSGKSSVFDSFLLKANSKVNNYKLSGIWEQYYEKIEQAAQSTYDIANGVEIDFHDIENVDFRSAFQVRSAYRNEADMHIQSLKIQSNRGPQFSRIIDQDEAVSRNYSQLANKILHDVSHSANDNTLMRDYRKHILGDLQEAMRNLFVDPELILQDFGGMKSGSFRFSKGSVSDFHYKNLSGGEKAAFDVLLDVFMRRSDSRDAIYCIDEPELHIATNLQGSLIAMILKLIPETAQLWIATHSIGIVRQAYKIQQNDPSRVAFLDFSNRDFDSRISMSPSVPNRQFWRNTYKVTLDDMASLVAPERIVICEGDQEKLDRGFDAKCYNKLFADESPDVLFISRGSSSQVKSKDLVEILGIVAEGVEVLRLVDRDEMRDTKRMRHIASGVRVLRRRELEEYLYDENVLRTLVESRICDKKTVEEILEKRMQLLDNSESQNIKRVSSALIDFICTKINIDRSRNDREFALDCLVPALSETPCVLGELREDIFGSR